jgi:hypothetical protein
VGNKEMMLAAFFEKLDQWDQAEDAELFLVMMLRRQRPSSLGRLAPFGCVPGLGALGVWGCGGPGKRPSLFT